MSGNNQKAGAFPPPPPQSPNGPRSPRIAWCAPRFPADRTLRALRGAAVAAFKTKRSAQVRTTIENELATEVGL